MSTIVVSHGYGARGDSVWFPSFAAELAELGHAVSVPDLPGTDAPRLGPWRDAFTEAATATPADDTVLVGHSIGGVNVLRTLEAHDTRTRGRFAGVLLVSTAAHEVGYDLLAEFFDGGFDWERIRAAATRFRVLAAADDPVNIPNPVEHVGHLVRELGATAVLTATGGHYGAHPDDHIQLPEATRLVTDILATKP